MFMPETILGAILTMILMLVAMKYHQHRTFHKSSMGLVILFDLAMPFYLYLNRDWKERLIDGGEIFSFLIWMHLGLVLTLYALYFMQILAGIKLAKTGEGRDNHKAQGKGIVLTRITMILTGALLYEPANPGETSL